MKKYISIVLLSILLLPGVVSAKELIIDNYNSGTNKNEYYEESVPTNDGGYITVGYSATSDVSEEQETRYSQQIIGLITKYDKNDQIVWEKTYDGSKAEYLNGIDIYEDGSFIVAGASSSIDISGITNKGYFDAIILKYDANGNLLWQKNYGGSNNDWYQSVEITKDGGFITAGYTKSTDIEGISASKLKDALLVKYTKDGTIEFQQTLKGNHNDSFNKVIQIDSEDYIVVGYSASINVCPTTILDVYGNGIIAKYNKNGELQWLNAHYETKQTGSALSSMQGTSPKISLSENKQYGYQDIIVDNEGNYIVVGAIPYSLIVSRSLSSERYAGIAKYSHEGDMISEQIYMDCSERMTGIIEVDDGYLVVGHSSDYHSPQTRSLSYEPQNSYITKIKDDFTTEWIKVYSGSRSDMFYDINKTIYDKYVVVGASSSPDLEGITNNGYSDAIVVTLNYKYDIVPTESTNGTYTINKVDNKGKIDIHPESGYELKDIIITDTAGNKISYYEENGAYYFIQRDDVTIDVQYRKIENPKTGDLLSYIKLGSLLIILGYTLKIIKNNKLNKNN